MPLSPRKIDIAREGCECEDGGGSHPFSKSHVVDRRGRQGRAGDIQVMYDISMLGGGASMRMRKVLHK